MNEIIIYETDENQIKVEVEFDGNTVWLNLNQLSALFDRDKSVISRHLRNIFKNKELEKDSVVAKNATTADDGKIYQVEYFNLDAILSVGYRVNSKKGTQFRIWANRILKDYLVNGYAINENRLAQKEQEVRVLKDGIQILTRSVGTVIEEKLSSEHGLRGPQPPNPPKRPRTVRARGLREHFDRLSVTPQPPKRPRNIRTQGLRVHFDRLSVTPQPPKNKTIK